MAETLNVSDLLNNTFEPKVKRRWVLRIEGIDAFICAKAARPTIATEAIEIPYINSRRWIAGPTKFSPVNVTLHDPIAPSGAQQVMEWIRLCFESVSGRAGYADFYKRNIQLCVLDPVGTVVELWEGVGAFITSSNFGDLDYSSSEVQMIELEIQADNWILQF